MLHGHTSSKPAPISNVGQRWSRSTRFTASQNSVSLALPGSNDANGVPIPPFLPQTLTATISDNSAVSLWPNTRSDLKLYPVTNIFDICASDPQTAFTGIGGNFLARAVTRSTTRI